MYDNDGPVRASMRANWNKTDDGQPAIFSQSANENNCLFDNGTLYRGQGRYYCGVIQPRQASSDYSRQFVDPDRVGLEAETLNAAFRLDVDLNDSLTLTSLTGYNKRTADNKTDGEYSGNSFNQVIFAAVPAGPAVGGVPPRVLNYFAAARSTQDFTFSSRSDTKDWSQELRLQFKSESVDVLLGGYYFRQDDDGRDTREIPAGAVALAQANANAATVALCARIPNCGSFTPIVIATTQATATAADLVGLYTPSRSINNFDIENNAVFGAVTVRLSPQFSISAEGRYAEERIRQATQTFNLGATAPAPSVVNATFKKFTPRITASWQATPNNLFYAVYAEGQKPGGFNGNTAIVAGFPTYNAETVKTFEFGMKHTLLDGKLIANFAAFQNTITGYQLTQNVSVPPNQVSLIVNAGDARIRGFEVELQARPVRNLTFTRQLRTSERDLHLRCRRTTGRAERRGGRPVGQLLDRRPIPRHDRLPVALWLNRGQAHSARADAHCLRRCRLAHTDRRQRLERVRGRKHQHDFDQLCAGPQPRLDRRIGGRRSARGLPERPVQGPVLHEERDRRARDQPDHPPMPMRTTTCVATSLQGCGRSAASAWC